MVPNLGLQGPDLRRRDIRWIRNHEVQSLECVGTEPQDVQLTEVDAPRAMDRTVPFSHREGGSRDVDGPDRERWKIFGQMDGKASRAGANIQNCAPGATFPPEDFDGTKRENLGLRTRYQDVSIHQEIQFQERRHAQEMLQGHPSKTPRDHLLETGLESLRRNRVQKQGNARSRNPNHLGGNDLGLGLRIPDSGIPHSFRRGIQVVSQSHPETRLHPGEEECPVSRNRHSCAVVNKHLPIRHQFRNFTPAPRIPKT